jgi:hypothetical protein
VKAKNAVQEEDVWRERILSVADRGFYNYDQRSVAVVETGVAIMLTTNPQMTGSRKLSWKSRIGLGFGAA